MTHDTDKRERIEPAMHPAVLEWLELRIKASRHYREDSEVLADFERLLVLAKGER